MLSHFAQLDAIDPGPPIEDGDGHLDIEASTAIASGAAGRYYFRFSKEVAVRSVAVLIAPLLILLLYSGPALPGQRSSQVLIVGASRSTVVTSHSHAVIIVRPLVSQPVIAVRPVFVQPIFVRPTFLRPTFLRPTFARPVIDRKVVAEQQVLIIPHDDFGPRQMLVFDRFGQPLD